MTRGGWLGGLGVVALLAVFPLFATSFAVSLALSILMYAGLALSWSMFTGPTRYVSLATSAFFGVGAYVSALAIDAMPWPVVILGGAITAVMLAALLGLCVLHLRGIYFAILTFGVSELIKNAVTYVEMTEFGTVGRIITTAPSDIVLYWTVLIVAALAAAAYAIVAASGFGAALRAIGSDEGRAATLGLNVRSAKLAGFCLSAAFPGAIGASVAVRWTYIDPRVVFDPFIVFQTVLIAMIGGPMKLRGPILGAVVFGLLEETLRLNFSYIYMIFIGALLVLSVMYIPDGLASISWPTRLRPGRPVDRSRHV